MIKAVLYGDDVPKGEPIGSIKGLERPMIEAGLPTERRFLQVKLQRVEEYYRVWTELRIGRTWDDQGFV
jgi:hypothetical protein